MNIVVIGGSGMVGARIVAEAADRGHTVTAASRTGGAADGASATTPLDFTDTEAVLAAIANADAAVISIAPDRTGGPHAPLVDAHVALIAARPQTRLVVIGGAGSLTVDGIKLKDTPEFPALYKPEADTLSTVLDLYRQATGIDWTVISPAPLIAPGERTGIYAVEADSPAGERISAEDFAVAVVDEIENADHRGTRFTVAN